MNNAFFSGLIDWIADIGRTLSESVSSINEATETALIGVLGTLLGTLLGWWLNSLSQKGKLDFFVVSWDDKFEKNEFGGMKLCTDKAEVELYSCKVALDIYNSSGNTKIMRNVQIVFASDRKEIRAYTPEDYATERFSAASWRCDKLEPVNIPPKTVIKLTLGSHEWEKDNALQDYFGINNIYLRYTDEKNKTKRVPLVKEDYKDYFLNHKVEEE